MSSQQKGFTIIELILAVAMMAIVILAAAKMTTPILRFFQRSQARQNAYMQMRSCQSTIVRMLQNGMVSTVNYYPPNNSKVQFQTVDGSTFTIQWDSVADTVHLLTTSAATHNTTVDSVLATQVAGLQFGIDNADAGIVSVLLIMQVQLDSSGLPGSYLTIISPKQTVQMVTS